MRAWLAATLMITLALAAGCAADRPGGPTPPTPAFRGVSVGMTAAEAESMAGAPLQRDPDPADGRQLEVWYYEGGVLILENSRVKVSHAAPGA